MAELFYSVSCCTPCSSTFLELAELSVPVGCNVAHCLHMVKSVRGQNCMRADDEKLIINE